MELSCPLIRITVVDLSALSNEALFGKLQALSETERFATTDFLFHLAELDNRKACRETGYSSVFMYLTRGLGLAEVEAARRVRAARAGGRYPSVFKMLARGDLNIVSVAMLQPLLTSENHQALLRKAARRSTREVERLVAEISPAKPLPRDRIRAVPAAAVNPAAADSALDQRENPPSGSEQQTIQSNVVRPMIEAGPGSALSFTLIPEEPIEQASGGMRVQFSFTADESLRDEFERARDLMRHKFPEGKMEEIIGEALRRLIDQENPARRRRPRTATAESVSSPALSSRDGSVAAAADAAHSRYIPRAVQDEVWRRDNGRCAFVDQNGFVCGATGWLEFDHVTPWALGGRSDDMSNIRLLCRTHNHAEAQRVFGTRAANLRA